MNKTISTQELKELHRSKEGSAVFNVLSKHDYQKDHIPGSKNAPIDSPDFLKDIESQTGGDKNKRVVVYCAGSKCDASTRAARKLVEAGYTNVQDYRGGMEEWTSSQSGGRGQRAPQSTGSANPATSGARAGSDAKEMAENRSTNKEQGMQYGKGTPPTPQRGGDQGRERPDPKKEGETQGDNAPGSNPEKREIGRPPPEPGYTTTAPHPDVIQPQTRTGERRTSPPETGAPKQGAPSQGAPSKGGASEPSSSGASQGGTSNP